ncbi:hypothetical protein SAMN05216556_11134 [Aequorivita viscosa]|nr:hypothetical protein SAMN05216556_11134 [Aequorivita viscosa]
MIGGGCGLRVGVLGIENEIENEIKNKIHILPFIINI